MPYQMYPKWEIKVDQTMTPYKSLCYQLFVAEGCTHGPTAPHHMERGIVDKVSTKQGLNAN